MSPHLKKDAQHPEEESNTTTQDSINMNNNKNLNNDNKNKQNNLNISSPLKIMETIATKGGEPYFEFIEQTSRPQLIELYETLNNKNVATNAIQQFLQEQPTEKRNSIIATQKNISNQLQQKLNQDSLALDKHSQEQDNETLTKNEWEQIRNYKEQHQQIKDFLHTDTNSPFGWFQMKGLFPEFIRYITKIGFDKVTNGDLKTEWINDRFHDILIEQPEPYIIQKLEEQTDPKLFDRLIRWLDEKLQDETYIPYTRLDLFRNWATRLDHEQRAYLKYFKDIIIPQKRRQLLEKQQKQPKRLSNLKSPWWIRYVFGYNIPHDDPEAFYYTLKTPLIEKRLHDQMLTGNNVVIEKILQTMQQTKLRFHSELTPSQHKLLENYIEKYQQELAKRYEEQTQFPQETSWSRFFRSVRPLIFPRAEPPPRKRTQQELTVYPQLSEVKKTIDYLQKHGAELMRDVSYQELQRYRQFIYDLRTVPTNSRVFLRGLLTMREKQILTSVIEIKKQSWG